MWNEPYHIYFQGLGLNGLNKGLTATIARNGVFNMMYFGFYHSVKGLFPQVQVFIILLPIFKCMILVSWSVLFMDTLVIIKFLFRVHGKSFSKIAALDLCLEH